jgi:hypothetical protein
MIPYNGNRREYPRFEMFCPEVLVWAAADAIRKEADRLALEQSPHGVDALPELGLHPVLGAGFAAAGFGVVAEQPYPGWCEMPQEGGKKRPSRPQRRDRQRCDLVLLAGPGSVLVDPVSKRMAAEREAMERAGTLFAGAEEREEVAQGCEDGGSSAAPEDAYWLEVKVVGQWCYTHGVPGPNRTYASEMVAVAADLLKLSADPYIRRGGLLLVVFAADRETAEHDVEVVVGRARKSLTGTVQRAEGFAISDRIGNAWCQVALLTATG